MTPTARDSGDEPIEDPIRDAIASIEAGLTVLLQSTRSTRDLQIEAIDALVRTGVWSAHLLTALWDDPLLRPVFEHVSGWHPELPCSFVNRQALEPYPDESSGERFRKEFCEPRLPLKQLTKTRGRKAGNDVLHQDLCRFVKAVSYRTPPIYSHLPTGVQAEDCDFLLRFKAMYTEMLRLHTFLLVPKPRPATVWAKAYIAWVKEFYAFEVVTSDGAFHPIAARRLAQRRKDQLKSSRSVFDKGEESGLWSAFGDEVVKRAEAVLLASP